MKLHRRIAPFITISLIAMVALVASCSDKGTNPTGGGATKELNSGSIQGGGVFTHTFANVGTFNYHCTIHDGMTGQVVVGAGSPASTAVAISNNTFTPSPAAVAPGGTVTWTNNGTTHTVTSD